MYIWSKRCKLLVRRRKNFFERLAHFKTCYFDCNVAYTLLHRYRKTPCFLLYLSHILKPSFPGFSNPFSLYFCSSPSNDHGRFSRSSARFTLAFFHSEISPSRIRSSRRREQALIANDCFRRAQSHLETLTALRFATILWDKCLTRRIIKREVGREHPDGGVEKPYSPTLVSSHEGVIASCLVRIAWVFSSPTLTIITIVVRLNIMTRRNSHSGACIRVD